MLPAVKNELKTLALAVHFLTRIPTPFDVDFSPQRLLDASRYYPLVGAIIGTVAALAFFITELALPTTIAVIIATAATALLTGAFHEDGLADTFDGVSGAHDRNRALEIMHDSRIGTFGTLALILVISTKIAALSSLSDTTTIIITLIAAHIISRTSIVIVQATSTYARETGIAGPQNQPLRSINTIIATLTALTTIASPHPHPNRRPPSHRRSHHRTHPNPPLLPTQTKRPHRRHPRRHPTNHRTSNLHSPSNHPLKSHKHLFPRSRGKCPKDRPNAPFETKGARAQRAGYARTGRAEEATTTSPSRSEGDAGVKRQQGVPGLHSLRATTPTTHPLLQEGVRRRTQVPVEDDAL